MNYKAGNGEMPPYGGETPPYGGETPPYGGAVRRRAGSENPAGMDGTVRDWQQESWVGPAPVYGNPFDEPEDAPELRDSRSENVNEHLGEFWEQDPTGYQYTGEIGARQAQARNRARTRQGGKRKKNREASRTSTLVRSLIALAIGLAALWGILRWTVFSLQDIRVEGNQRISSEEILQISGMHIGDSLLGLDERTVEERINADYRLQFRYLEKKIPGQAVLRIREREACCWLTYGGILYTMDKNRMIMYETEDLDHLPAELVEVKGLKIRSGCRTGQTLSLSDHRQELLISNLFLEMKVLGCTADILEVDLSNLSSLLMMTRDGYTVSLGDSSEIHAKLRSLLLVRDKLVSMGLAGGTINITNPENPLYSPPSV